MLGRHEGLSVTYRCRQQLANARERHPYAIHQHYSKFVGTTEKADSDRLTNLVTWMSFETERKSLAESSVSLNLIFLIKMYCFCRWLRTIPKLSIYFFNCFRWRAFPFLRMTSSHPPSKSRPVIHRPLFKQLFFLQLFTFETNARQFVTKSFLLSVFLFLLDSHHVRASTSKISSTWRNVFHDNPAWWSSLFNHSGASRTDDPIEKLLLRETRLPL